MFLTPLCRSSIGAAVVFASVVAMRPIHAQSLDTAHHAAPVSVGTGPLRTSTGLSPAAAARMPALAALPAELLHTEDLPLELSFVAGVSRERRGRARVLPYSLAGLLLGGVLGYLYYDRVAETPHDEDWGVGAIIYPALGASIGVIAGTVVGNYTNRP